MASTRQRISPELERALDAGDDAAAGLLVQALRRPTCPVAVVVAAAEKRWVLARPRVLVLMLRHPRCPRPFAVGAIQRLGYFDLAEACRDPRMSAPIRQQTERRIVERLPTMTVGERIALARVATRPVVIAMLGDPEERCIDSLLDNSRFTEVEALRLVATNRSGSCVARLARHPVWGRRRDVMRALLCASALPLGVALGVAASMPDGELRRAMVNDELSDQLRAAVSRLIEARTHGENGKAELNPS